MCTLTMLCFMHSCPPPSQKYLHVTDKSQDAAAMLLAKYVPCSICHMPAVPGHSQQCFMTSLPLVHGGPCDKAVTVVMAGIMQRVFYFTLPSFHACNRFITRPDQITQKLPEFVDWCLVILNSADSECVCL